MKNKMMSLKLLIVSLLSVTSLLVTAQNKELDSLRNVLESNPGDKAAEIEFAVQLRYVNPDSAYQLLTNLLVEIDSSKRTVDYCRILRNRGVIHYNRGEYELALAHYRRAETLLPESKEAFIEKGNLLNNIGYVYDIYGRPDTCMILYRKSMQYYDKGGDSLAIADVYNNMGVAWFYASNFDSALYFYNKALEWHERNNVSEEFEADARSNLGNVYFQQNDLKKAIENYLEAERVYTKLEVENKLVIIQDLLGDVYEKTQRYDLALKYNRKAAVAYEQMQYRRYLANKLMSIGNIYEVLRQVDTVRMDDLTDSALLYYNKAKTIFVGTEDPNGMGYVYNNLGIMYLSMHELDSAENYLTKAYSLRIDRTEELEMANTLIALGELYNLRNNGSKAASYLEEAYKISTKHDIKDNEVRAGKLLAEAYAQLGKYSLAYETLLSSYMQFDSLQIINSKEAISEMQEKYESEKKERENELLRKSNELDKVKLKEETLRREKEEEINRSNQQKILMLGIGILVILILGVFVLKEYFAKKKANEIISKQKAEVEFQRDMIEEQHQEIRDSISYAQRIQAAILPTDSRFKAALPNAFVLYKPKDVVAGDFYWLEKKEGEVYFAAADCTGHGVPGAMVSVVCNNALNRSVREYGCTVPGKLLDKTRELVIKEFESGEEGGEVKDGMDIALCKISGNKIYFSGAHNPLWVIRRSPNVIDEQVFVDVDYQEPTFELEEIKGDKQPIGKFDFNKPFSTQETIINPGDTCYVFSDGFADQFGGTKGKKFKAANLKKLLLSIQNESMERQKELLDEAFEDWRGDLEQIDDVCLIGVRI